MRTIIFSAIVSCVLAVAAAFTGGGALAIAGANPAHGEEAHGLTLSDMKVSITSQGRTAIFQLYETGAAKEFFEQLPLTLPLTNFRDAQWMFYPPQELTVTAAEAYHDGKKGELSYYAPSGDVFMLYEDFHARDEMHRLGVSLSGVDRIADMSGEAIIEKAQPTVSGAVKPMRIAVSANGNTVVYELNDSGASRALYAQLPMTIGVEDYADNEKIFYPPSKLDTADTPLAQEVTAGTLAYYAPWGDVVMFYEGFRPASGLYHLGQVVSGQEFIESLSGTIQIEKAGD